MNSKEASASAEPAMDPFTPGDGAPNAIIINEGKRSMTTTRTTNDNAPPPTYTCAQELSAILSERQVLQLTEEEDELLDPLERAVRYVIPIPKYYYWDVVKSEADLKDVSTRIKLWHNTIGYATAVGTWTSTKIGQPIISGLGLTTSRFAFVTDQMTNDDMESSRRSITERQQQDEQHELSERSSNQDEQGELQDGRV